ncbi:MAG: Flp pilus assembly protein CpaB, partial [Planctomycetaceae bacterium]
MKITPALLTVVMLLVVGSLVTAFIAKRMLADEALAVSEPINVPMALTDLKPGTVITEAHIGLAPVRPEDLDREVLQTSRVVVGRIVKNPITRAQPIHTSDLYAPGERPPLVVAAGMRAGSVAREGRALGVGLIEPGQFADVHFIPSGNVSPRGGMVLTLFQGVKVLAMSRSQSPGSSQAQGAGSVTFELTPEQANVMLLARNRGSINLTYSPHGPGNGGVAVAQSDRAFLDEIL